MLSKNNSIAELDFRNSFERLKADKPLKLPKGTTITQNNIAREAGKDPSALRKSRYPILILEIQEYLSNKKETLLSESKKRDNVTKTKNQKISNYRKQIDRLCSIVASQNIIILELKHEVELLKEGNVLRMNKDD